MPRVCRFVIVVGLAFFCISNAVAQYAGQNINMVSGTLWPAGDPYLQRQNEPSMAVSSRNPEHLMGGANDYRTVDIPNPQAPNILGDAWLGVYTSLDGGETWKSTLLPGYPQDTSAVGRSSPLHSYTVATDSTVRAGTHGLFYYSGLVFNRGSGAPSGVFVSTFQDQNNKGNGDLALLTTDNSGTHGNPFLYLNTYMIDTGVTGQFLDKPWIAVDIARPGRTATCKINGQTISSGYAYVVYTQFNGSANNPASKIKVSSSSNCGLTWNQPQVLSQSEKLAQGTVAAIDPNNGNVYVAWRQISTGGQNQPDAIQYAVSTNGGVSFSSPPPVYTFVATSNSNPYPPGSVFDQPQASTTTFRSLDVPTIAVDANSRVWLAFSQRFNGPTAGTYGSRIMITTLPSGSNSWSKPYVADSTAPTSTVYGHQFLPSLSFAYGKLMLSWFDSRRDNLESVLTCPSGTNCTSLPQLTAQDQPIPGSTISNLASVFTALISDPNSGVRHTIDVFGAMVDPSAGPTPFTGMQISQYGYFVDSGNNNQIEQAFYNPPNLPMFVQGTQPFIGDYIDIAAQNIMPSGNSWVFNTQGKDPVTGATNAPDFHVTWTDNRDVVPPPVVNGSQDWTQYVPPNSGQSQSSTYSSTGLACPTCALIQPACTSVVPDGGGSSAYSGDRNQNVYTSRISNGLIVRFKENAKPLSAAVSQRTFSLLVKNTITPLKASPLGAPSFYRILLGVTSTSQTPSCNISGGTATIPGTPNCYLDVAIDPNTTLAQAITVNSTTATASANVLVAQIQAIPDGNSAPTFTGLQALAVINSDPSNPSVANPDFVTADNSNPDIGTPYGNLPIAAGEEYDPTVIGPANPLAGINTPKIGVPAINTPKIGTVTNSSPMIETPSINTPKIGSEIASVQIVNPTIVDTINTPKINTPKINTPKIVDLSINTPKITDLSDTSNPVTDYSWTVNNKGNTSASYDTTEFPKAAGVSCCPASCSSNPNSCSVTASNPAGPNCSVCQLIQQKVYESPVANRDYNTSSNSAIGNPTCDLNVQQAYTTVANIGDPAFSSGTLGGSPANPSNSTLSLSPGEGNRVTLRVVAAPVSPTVGSFKTVATSFTPDTGQNTSSSSLTITTSALPVAVVGQNYANTALTSLGGFGAAAWSVPANPSNPVAVTLPISPEPLPVTPLTLSQSGQISTDVVTAAPGTYTINMQVQDAAGTPNLDVQQVQMEVNQFTISNVDPMIVNEVGTTGFMKAGDMATVAVTVSSVGPATATSVAPTLTVNAVSGGAPSGPLPSVTCGSPTPASATITGTGTQMFAFTCSAVSGNGFVTFTAKATGYYVNSAASVQAIATPVSQPTLTPSGTPPNVVVDTTAPTLTYGATTSTPSAPGWFNKPVVIPFTTSDNLSGVMSAVATSPASSTGLNSGALTLTTEGKLVTGVMTVEDYAKNIAAPFTSAGYNIDETPPTISGAATPAANANGWNNSAVMVKYTCNDPIPTNGPFGQQSGIAACPATAMLSLEGMNQSASGTATDVAGNSTNTTVTGINIDTTPPTISGAPTSPANANGWYNTPVTVAFVCVDPSPLNPVAAGALQSGIATCTSAMTLSANGANQSVPGSATDKAGNSAAALVSGISIDQTPPAITANSSYAGGWTNQSVTVTFACTDNLSGPAANNPVITGIPGTGATLSYNQNGLTSTATVTLTANTPVTGVNLSASCQDLAGNNATPVQFGPIQIDTTAPIVTVTANLGTANGPIYQANTWTNQSVVVTVACTDALSGVKTGSIQGNNAYVAQGTYAVSGSCMDNAGNSGTASFGNVEIDTTTPAVMITSPLAQTYLLNQQITPSFTCGDNSGGDTTTCTATPSASPYTASAVGPATFNLQGTDQAGNTSSASVSYLVIYNFTGFQAPLQSAVMLNLFNSQTSPQPSDSGSFTIGTTIPIAWQMQDANSAYISDLTTITSIVAIPNPACAGAVSAAGTTLYNATTGQAAFSYVSATNNFLFNWNTTGATAGCYNLVVTTNDTAQWSTIVHLATDTFAGFDAPLTTASAPANPSLSGTFDTGSTIPVMWQLNTPGVGPDSSQNVTLSNVTAYANAGCSGAPPSGAGSTVLYDRTSNTGTFNFEPTTAGYTVNWATGSAPAGCYDIVATLSDQSVYTTMVTLAAP